MVNNGSRTEREGGVFGYWGCQGCIEGMRSSGELLVEVGGRLAQRLAQDQSGTGNGDGHIGGQSGSTAHWDSTQASITSIFGHPQVL